MMGAWQNGLSSDMGSRRSLAWLIAPIIAGTASALLASYLLLWSPEHAAISHWAFPLTVFSEGFQVVLCVEGAFLGGMLAFRAIGVSMRGSIGMVAALVFSVLFGCGVSPFVASFPPLVAFLCRVGCPEALYYPRPYSAGCSVGRNVHSFLEAMIACCALGVLSLSMFGEAFFSMRAWGYSAVALWVLCATFVAVALLLLCMRKRQGNLPGTAKVIFFGYHAFEIWFWIMFCSVVAVWLAG